MDTLIFITLTAISALFSASETALFSLRDSQVRLMERRGERNAHLIAKLKADPQRLLVTLLFGNTLANLTIASLATVLAIGYFESFGAGIATGVSAVLILLLAELFPKSAAITYKKRCAQLVAYPIYFCYIVLYPASTLFVWLERWIKRYAKIPEHGLVSEEEIRIMAELGLEHGKINRYEHEMIENIFQFDNVHASEVMTPKDNIEALNGEVPVEQIAYFVSQSGFSRFPVYDGNDNNYVGYVHTNDVMRVLNSDDRDIPLMKIVSPLTLVDETTDTETIFRLMTKKRSHMFLVHKKGNPKMIIGLVTMEDLLEEIMGEIEDEGDRRAKK
jgi:CBS domain containing-hemolysin-like protein